MNEPHLFGSATRTRVLTVLASLESTYPRELARVAKVPLVSAQRIINDLERQGVVATRLVGKQREVRLSPRYFARSELAALLQRLEPAIPGLRDELSRLRRRPRRAGKPL